MTRAEQIQSLLNDPENLLMKLPFTRGSSTYNTGDANEGDDNQNSKKRRAKIPSVSKKIVTQEKFLKELDPMCHNVIFDQNVPTICVKLDDGTVREVGFVNTPIGLQERIASKNTLSLCGNHTVFTQIDKEPTDKQKENFSVLKQYWDSRNQDGMRTKMVYTQYTQGDAALLYYFNEKKEIKCRLLCYSDGYVLIPHNDENGDRLLESVYYVGDDGVEYIDSYDDTYMYRMSNKPTGDAEGNTWQSEPRVAHGFSEIPIVSKRGDVAWNNVEPLIEAFEILYNIIMVIEKRHGWGILYVKGKFKTEAQQIAGSIILNDSSRDGKGSAEFKTPDDPSGYWQMLDRLFKMIQIGSSTTFILPDDINISGQTSALAIKLAEALDLEKATLGVIDWQNVIDKMCRLFKEGLAKELVNKGINPTAITDFEDLNINARMKVWQPFDDISYNQMLLQMAQGGILSTQTAIEKNTISVPDEQKRMDEQAEKAKQDVIDKMLVNNGNGTKIDSNSDTPEGDNASGNMNNNSNNNDNIINK